MRPLAGLPVWPGPVSHVGGEPGPSSPSRSLQGPSRLCDTKLWDATQASAAKRSVSWRRGKRSRRTAGLRLS